MKKKKKTSPNAENIQKKVLKQKKNIPRKLINNKLNPKNTDHTKKSNFIDETLDAELGYSTDHNYENSKKENQNEKSSGKNTKLTIPSIPKDEKEKPRSFNRIKEIIDLDQKSVLSPNDELLDSRIDVGASHSSLVDFDDIDDIIKKINEDSLQKLKEDKTTPTIPNHVKKNKSLHKSNTKFESPYVTEETIANNNDDPNIYSETPSIRNPTQEADSLDISDEIKNSESMMIEDSEVEKIEDVPTTTKKQPKADLTEKNQSKNNIVANTKKPEKADIVNTSNFSDDKPDDQLAYINDLLNENEIGGILNDESIGMVPTTVKLPKSETELPTSDPLDENENTGQDSILQKVALPKTGLPNPNVDIDSGRNMDLLIPSIPKVEEEKLKSLNENQEINDLDHKSVLSPIDELLKSHIDVGGSQSSLVDFDNIDASIKKINKENLQKSKEDKTTPKIPNLLKKNKSLEKSNTKFKAPYVTEETIAKNNDKPNIYSETPSIGKPAQVADVFDILDEYKDLGSMTMEGFDVGRTEDITTTIPIQQKNDLTEKNKSISNIYGNTIKPEIADFIEGSNFSDEKPKEELSFINSLSYPKANYKILNEKSDSSIPMTNTFSKAESRLSSDAHFDKNMKVNSDSILHKIIQPTPFESKTGKPFSIVDGDGGKNIDLLTPSISKTEEEMPKNIFSGNSENAVSILNSAHNGFNPSSLNSKVSIPEHRLITDKNEQSTVSNVIDRHNNNLFYGDGESYGNGGSETKRIIDNDLNSKNVSKNKYKDIPYDQTKGENKKFSKTAHIDEHTNYENLNELGETKNNISHFTPSIIISSEDNSPIISDYNLMNKDNNPYGCMLRKFATKYAEGGDSNNNLWETVPPKKLENLNNYINQSNGYTASNRISSHVNNDKKIDVETEAVKNSYDDKGNADIHNNLYDGLLKKISEQLFKKIDNIDDKISKFDKSSNNGSYIKESYNTRSDDPSTKQIILMNGLPNSKPKNKNDIEESDSKTSKSVESFETIESNKSNDRNEIKESIKIQKDEDKKHEKKNKKHKKHSKHDKYKKKKIRKKNEIIDSDNDDSSYKNNKYQKKKDIKNDDDRFKKNKNKNEIIDYDSYDDDNDDHHHHKRKKKSHKKNYINDDDDDDDDDRKRKKKSHKKNYTNDDDVKVSRSKKTDNKKKKKKKESISPHESNEVNSSTSLQINSEDNNSVKGLKMKSKPKKTNSTKSKKSLPKKKSKHKKRSKSISYKNKDITVDVSDKDSSSNENNYNLEKTYVKTSSNNNQNNAPKQKKHKHEKSKHKKHKKPLKTKKIYKYKESPVNNEDKSSDENNVNLEETYNINITKDDKALKQKRLRHKRLKNMKNIDINIVKDTDNQVLNKDTKTMHGYQFYTFYNQYPYTNLFGRLFPKPLYVQ